jgi:hypothetical protein
MDGWRDGWIDRRMYREVNGCLERRMDGWMDREMDG